MRSGRRKEPPRLRRSWALWRESRKLPGSMTSSRVPRGNKLRDCGTTLRTAVPHYGCRTAVRSFLSPRKNLLEQRESTGIARLPQPEQSFLSDLGIAIRSRDVDQRRHPLAARPLRQRKDRLLPNV